MENRSFSNQSQSGNGNFYDNKKTGKKEKKQRVKARMEEFDCLHDIPNLSRRNSRGIPQIVEYHAKQQKTLLVETIYHPHRALDWRFALSCL